ncbi:hypothetical protein HMPREF1986_01291 [Oribacterium sp. oral taxon 078 str. F0263]|nr:hypothetical protein HMPREF1986_01291 [Oribacterium sp. oral taxon 078 str. F0263]
MQSSSAHPQESFYHNERIKGTAASPKAEKRAQSLADPVFECYDLPAEKCAA